MRFLKTKLLTLLTLMLCMGVFCSVTAFASDSGETLRVTAAWVDGELLRINVTDINGVNSALALRLSDYVNDAENKEYISIQAVDLAGNKSGIIEIKNPFYDPTAVPAVTITPHQTTPPQNSESAVGNGGNPFTPDGAGTVIDNAHSDGKEFFTIGTEDGSVFYLIVDRQRNADNVYLLNSVTLDDLVALAVKSGTTINTNPGGSTSAIETPGQTEQPGTTENPTENNQSTTNPPEPTETPTVTPPKKNDTTMYILIGIITVAVGGAGYYFKIVKGKKNNAYDDDDEDEEESEDDYGYEDEADDDEDGGDKE
jgi:hypothetical protein